MLIYWALIKKFWWLLPVTALCITAGVYRIERDRARTQVAALQSRLTSLEDITAANAAKAAHDKDIADASLQSAVGAANILGADLSRRVREYEDRVCPDPVQATGEPVQASRIDPVPAAIGQALAACARDAARLDNAVQWAEGLR